MVQVVVFKTFRHQLRCFYYTLRPLFKIHKKWIIFKIPIFVNQWFLTFENIRLPLYYFIQSLLVKLLIQNSFGLFFILFALIVIHFSFYRTYVKSFISLRLRWFIDTTFWGVKIKVNGLQLLIIISLLIR